MAIRFNKEWMDKVEYKDWLLPEPSNNTKAKCRLCMRSFSLSNMGEPALKSHAQGKKHQNAVKKGGKIHQCGDFKRRMTERLQHLHRKRNH